MQSITNWVGQAAIDNGKPLPDKEGLTTAEREELVRLLASFEAVLPLREASHLSTPQTLEHILRRSEGTIGEMATLLARAADFALRNGDEKISEAAITQAEYLPPSVRRRAIERTLR